MLKIDKKQHNKVVRIKFEKFFKNFKNSRKACKHRYQDNVSHKFDLDNTLKNLYKYKRHLSIKEIKYINKNLAVYLMKKSLIYIADFSPNMSAYVLHVLKMCDAFSELKYSVKLIFHKENTYKYSKIKRNFY